MNRHPVLLLERAALGQLGSVDVYLVAQPCQLDSIMVADVASATQ